MKKILKMKKTLLLVLLLFVFIFIIAFGTWVDWLKGPSDSIDLAMAGYPVCAGPIVKMDKDGEMSHSQAESLTDEKIKTPPKVQLSQSPKMRATWHCPFCGLLGTKIGEHRLGAGAKDGTINVYKCNNGHIWESEF
jgi:hypothetical protein